MQPLHLALLLSKQAVNNFILFLNLNPSCQILGQVLLPAFGVFAAGVNKHYHNVPFSTW